MFLKLEPWRVTDNNVGSQIISGGRNLQLTYKHLFLHSGLLSVQLFLLQPLQLDGIIPVAQQKKK